MTKEERNEIVKYRFENAEKTLAEVKIHCQNGFYNTAINRIYYACYYATSALLIANEIETKTHDGVRQMLGLHFVKTGKISVDMGRFYTEIFAKRSSGDYEDFISYDLKTVEIFLPLAEQFIFTIKQLIFI